MWAISPAMSDFRWVEFYGQVAIYLVEFMDNCHRAGPNSLKSKYLCGSNYENSTRIRAEIIKMPADIPDHTGQKGTHTGHKGPTQAPHRLNWVTLVKTSQMRIHAWRKLTNSIRRSIQSYENLGKYSGPHRSHSLHTG